MPVSRRPAPVQADEAVDATRALAFVNTLSYRPTPEPKERLTSYQALLDWARDQKLVPPSAADRLATEARHHPQAAAAALARARELRETLQAVFSEMAAGRTPPTSALDVLSERVAAAYANGRLVALDGRLLWAAGAADHLDRIGWELARAAARLVTSDRLSAVRACEADDCGWWFVDETKNHSRRWCDMKSCGNREKMRRYRARASR